jgi:predicted nucleic acid-binding OB-fold protein
VGVLDELIVLLRFLKALRMIEEEREKRAFNRFKRALKRVKSYLARWRRPRIRGACL